MVRLMSVALRNQSGSVLLVEDDPRVLDALADLLETKGYAVRKARNGQEALAAVKDCHPGLILLDLSMPVMDGWEFMRQQRLEPGISDVPVIVITALISAVPAGAKALITKPINVSRLMALIERHCLPL